MKAFLLDFDGFLAEGEFWEEMAKEVGKPELAEITREAMAGEKRFEEALEERVEAIRGVEREVVLEVGRKVKLKEDAHELVEAIRKRGVEPIIVSGGFREVIEEKAKLLGVRRVIANQFEFHRGAVDGFERGVDKGKIVEEMGKRYGIFAGGDGANDIIMVKKAHIGFGLRGKATEKAGDVVVEKLGEIAERIRKPVVLVARKARAKGEFFFLPLREKHLPLAEALVVRSEKVGKEELESAKELKLIVRMGVGLDNIDVEEARRRGIKVFNTPLSAPSVAELTIALMVIAARRLHTAMDGAKRGKWEKHKFVGMELNGKTLGIIGLGRIGRTVAEIAKAMGMRIIFYDPYVEEPRYEKVELDELIRKSDVITLHAPLTRESYGMIGEREVGMMRRGVIIINAARGKLITPQAIEKGLREDIFGAIALDVHWEEPFGEWAKKVYRDERVIATPHIGGNTEEALARMEERVSNLLTTHLC